METTTPNKPKDILDVNAIKPRAATRITGENTGFRLGRDCTRQNGAVRLSLTRIKATNLLTFLSHNEASAFCLPVCVLVC